MDNLIVRLKARAADPERRTAAPQSLTMAGPGGTLTTMFGSFGGGPPGSMGTMNLGGLLDDLRSVVASNQAGRAIDPAIAGRVDAMAADFSMTNPATSGALPAPASPGVLDDAERRVGRPLPADLRRVYGEIANGGFGPGGGLLPIEHAVDLYLELRTDPPGPRGQAWPEGLLPLRANDPGFECLDLASGRIVDWDPEDLTERSGDAAWQRSFAEVASSLEAWLAAWVESRPAHEVMQEQLEASTIAQARAARATIAAMTPEQRAAMGLPEVGWEKVVWDGIGLEDE
ncbi:MAG: SMI1/KNR4 family protein [Chloroflexi bacterium]|nr:SMI1/KNR4 family protein [Chloroflexota bacterium]